MRHFKVNYGDDRGGEGGLYGAINVVTLIMLLPMSIFGVQRTNYRLLITCEHLILLKMAQMHRLAIAAMTAVAAVAIELF